MKTSTSIVEAQTVAAAPMPELGPRAAARLGAKATRGFSLIEILVAVGLLSLIVLGLVAMFGQTQRAFKTSLTDTDLLENGRIVTDIMSRELAAARPFFVSNAVNFFVEVPQIGEAAYAPMLRQGLPGTTTIQQQRNNYLEAFYFLTRPNQGFLPDETSVAIGYFVQPDQPNVGIGTLYRVSVTNNVATNGVWPLMAFTNALLHGQPLRYGLTNVSAVAEGVVHLRVRPFAPGGHPIFSYGSFDGATAYCTNPLAPMNVLWYRRVAATTNHVNNNINNCPEGYDQCKFWSNALPASVEVELGILEPQIYQRVKAIGSVNPAAQRNYLSNHVAQVHLFRQRIPLHNVDPSAYP